MFPIEKYHLATSIEDAVQALSQDAEAKVLAGGTDVLIRLHEGDLKYSNLVDINPLDELREIRQDADGNILIGSLASFNDIIEHELVKNFVPVIGDSLSTIGGPQVRNRGTMGGNFCNGAVSADSACAALVHEMDLVIQGPSGERVEPAVGFHTGPGKVKLAQGDILKYFRIAPKNYLGFGTAYHKYAMRGAMDIATIGCAAAVKRDGDIFQELRLAFTVSAPTPVRCVTAEKLAVGQVIGNQAFQAIAEAAISDVNPRNSWRAGRDFRLHVIKTLAKRVTQVAAEKQAVKANG